MSRIWPNLASGPRGCLTFVLGIFVLLGLGYWGYCWGWWGRTNLVLQYLLQCRCPVASEAARYRPYKVLASACQHPRVSHLSPSGQFLIFNTAAEPSRIQRQNISTGEVVTLPLHKPEITRVYNLDDQRLFVDICPIGQFMLLDLTDNTQTPLPWTQAHTLETDLLSQLHHATEVFVLTGTIVALAPNYKQDADQNLVIYIVPSQVQPAIIEQLTATGIDLTVVPDPYTTGLVQGALYLRDGLDLPNLPDSLRMVLYSRDRLFWADSLGIVLANTGTRIVTLDLPRLAPPVHFRPFGWTPDNRAVVYAAVYAGGRMPHLIDWVYPGWKLFPVPQPILLVEVPEEYRE